MLMKKFDRFASWFANIREIRSIRRGLIYMMPLTLIGSFVLALLNMPIPAFHSFMELLFGEGFRRVGLAIHGSTLNIMAILALFTVSYAYSHEFSDKPDGRFQSISIMITSLSSYLVLTHSEDGPFYSGNIGTASMLTAMVAAIAAGRLFILFCSIRDRFVPKKAISYHGDALLQSSFRVVFPSLATILSFCLLKELLSIVQIEKIAQVLMSFLNERIMAAGNLFSAIIVILITHILWFIGVHGGNVVMDSIAVLSGQGINGAVSIFSKEFFDIFVYLGGAGATLGLLLALLFAGTRNNEKSLGTYSILPGIFNINEMLIYGLPVLFSPYYLVPFLLSPVVLCIVTYAAMEIGIVPAITESVQWTTPIFISGYISTGSLMGSVMQGLNLCLSALIYIPFIRMQERNQRDKRSVVYKQLLNEVQYIKEERELKIITKSDDIGDMARSLAFELENELNGGMKSIYLEYQPKVNNTGEVVGAEALLRWIHPVYGYISPLVLLGITDECGLTTRLGTWVIKQAFSELKRWHDDGYSELSLSVNLSPLQLREDDDLVNVMKTCVQMTGIHPKYMEVELTENAAIDTTDEIKNRLKQIRTLGISISIDDFGMGHSSLLYLCNLYANVVKLDTSLIKSIHTDVTRQNIVKSIISLCSELEVDVVAEGVETKEQRDILMQLGCNHYQGFYFSKSLPKDRFSAFLKERGMQKTDK